jgi:hypothetical protein
VRNANAALFGRNTPAGIVELFDGEMQHETTQPPTPSSVLASDRRRRAPFFQIDASTGRAVAELLARWLRPTGRWRPRGVATARR